MSCYSILLLSMCLISITAITSDDVRLSGGFTANHGATQVKIDGVWRYLCDTNTREYHNSLKGDLVCQNVGYKAVKFYQNWDSLLEYYCQEIMSFLSDEPLCQNYFSGYHFDPDAVYINSTVGYWTSNITCDDDDVKLMNCRNTGWESTTTCATYTNTIVYCTGEVSFGLVPPLADESPILVYDNKLDRYEHMCAVDFNEPTARVFCKQMGYKTGAVTSDYLIARDLYSDENNFNDVLMLRESYKCNGTEARLTDCKTVAARSNCSTYIAIAKCTGVLYRAGKVVRFDDVDAGYGIVRVYDDKGQAKAVCADEFDSNAAKVACRGRGLGDDGRLLPPTAFRYLKPSRYKGRLKNSFVCQGTEVRLRDCDSENRASCSRTDFVVVAFKAPSNSTVEGTTRIQDDGRVEVFYHGLWGTVCPRRWDDNAAKVVCKGLAQHSKAGVIAMKEKKPRWVFDVNCTGDEDKLDSCQITRDDPNFECDTSDHAAAYCYNNTFDFRLTGGGRNYGYVQLSRAGLTGYLRVPEFIFTPYGYDRGRPDHFSTAACNRLGFNGGIEYTMPELCTVYWWCASTDDGFPDFPLLSVPNGQAVNSTKTMTYLSVFCYDKVRLDSVGDGIVLEYKYKQYYAFCADGFAQKEGDAVCRQLDYLRATNVTVVNSRMDKSEIGFHNFTCPEGANSTDECTSTFTGNGDGCMSRRAYVSCEMPVAPKGGCNELNSTVAPTDASNGLETKVLLMLTTVLLVHGIKSLFDI